MDYLNNKFDIIRIHVSNFEGLSVYLSDNSDHTIEDRYIFSKLFNDYESYYSFIAEFPENINRYDKEYFVDNSLIVMFNDERSGSNRLAISDVSIVDNNIDITINRERELTMDMAYLVMFYEVDNKDLVSSSVHIEDIY